MPQFLPPASWVFFFLVIVWSFCPSRALDQYYHCASTVDPPYNCTGAFNVILRAYGPGLPPVVGEIITSGTSSRVSFPVASIPLYVFETGREPSYTLEFEVSQNLNDLDVINTGAEGWGCVNCRGAPYLNFQVSGADSLNPITTSQQWVAGTNIYRYKMEGLTFSYPSQWEGIGPHGGFSAVLHGLNDQVFDQVLGVAQCGEFDCPNAVLRYFGVRDNRFDGPYSAACKRAFHCFSNLMTPSTETVYVPFCNTPGFHPISGTQCAGPAGVLEARPANLQECLDAPGKNRVEHCHGPCNQVQAVCKEAIISRWTS